MCQRKSPRICRVADVDMVDDIRAGIAEFDAGICGQASGQGPEQGGEEGEADHIIGGELADESG